MSVTSAVLDDGSTCRSYRSLTIHGSVKQPRRSATDAPFRLYAKSYWLPNFKPLMAKRCSLGVQIRRSGNWQPVERYRRPVGTRKRKSFSGPSILSLGRLSRPDTLKEQPRSVSTQLASESQQVAVTPCVVRPLNGLQCLQRVAGGLRRSTHYWVEDMQLRPSRSHGKIVSAHRNPAQNISCAFYGLLKEEGTLRILSNVTLLTRF